MRNRSLIILCLMLLSLSVSAQSSLQSTTAQTMKDFTDSRIVKFDNKWYKLSASFHFPANLENLERHLSNSFFMVEKPSLEDAYIEYAASFIETKPISEEKKADKRLISYQVEMIVESPEKYYDIRTLYTHRFEEKKGLITEQHHEKHFIYDILHDKVLTLEDIFVPEVLEEMRQKIGKSASNMAMDEERIVFGINRARNQTILQYRLYPTYFTNEFKQLVYIDWKSIEDDIAKQSSTAQIMKDFTDSRIVKSDNKWYKLLASFHFPANLENLERHLSNSFFKVESSSLEEAYKEYTATFIETRPMSEERKADNRLISYQAEMIFESPEKYCDIHTLYTHRFEEKKGLTTEHRREKHFIYDMLHDKVLTIEDIFVPEVLEEIQQKIGKSASNMAMDEEKIVFGMNRMRNPTIFQYRLYPSYFTKKFKQLVYIDWKSLEDDYAKTINRQYEVEKEQSPQKSTIVYDVVEKMPSFPNGNDAMIKFVCKHLIYPLVDIERGIQGTVICNFVVEADGSLTNIKVIKSVSPSIDEAAIKLINSMPLWEPGTQNGKPVRVRFSCPVKFKLP